jgi:hypothetical protein
MRYLPSNPASELALPCCENRLAERILSEEDVAQILADEAEHLPAALDGPNADAKEPRYLLIRALHAAQLFRVPPSRSSVQGVP